MKTFIGKKFPTVTSFIDYSHLHAVKILSIRLKTPHLTGEELSYSAVSTLKIAKVHLIDTITCIINQLSDSSSECKIRNFMVLGDIHENSKGFLVNHTLAIRSKFDVIYTTQNLS